MRKKADELKGIFVKSVELTKENNRIKFLVSDLKLEKKELQQQLVSMKMFKLLFIYFLICFE